MRLLRTFFGWLISMIVIIGIIIGIVWFMGNKVSAPTIEDVMGNSQAACVLNQVTEVSRVVGKERAAEALAMGQQALASGFDPAQVITEAMNQATGARADELRQVLDAWNSISINCGIL